MFELGVVMMLMLGEEQDVSIANILVSKASKISAEQEFLGARRALKFWFLITPILVVVYSVKS